MREDSPNPLSPAKKAALAGAGAGAVMGAGSAILGGKKKALEILKDALIGAGTYGTISGGSIGLGNELVGDPTPDETTGYSRRGGLGGVLGGALGGAAIGGLLSSGKVKVPKFLGDNLITDYVKKLAANSQGLKGAALGGLGGAALGGVTGYDEGLGLDSFNNEMQKRKRDAYKQRLAQEIAEGIDV